jgi:predicted nucleic acid-binding protein
LIYLDTSVALAQLLAEDRLPSRSLWSETLVSSRLLQYEVWTRLHARGLALSHGEPARLLIGRVAILELAPPVLARALEPFPLPVRALDALHLASIEFLRGQGQKPALASYDEGLSAVARRMGIPLAEL